MEKLKEQFRKHGYDYSMVNRSDIAAIFQQSDAGKVIAFEVIKVRISKACHTFGKDYPEREIYPGDNEWGLYGWTYKTLADAQARFNQLNTVPEKEIV